MANFYAFLDAAIVSRPYHRSGQSKTRPGEPFRFIDVREAEEYALARIEGAELLPLSRAAEWIGTLDPDQEYVFFATMGCVARMWRNMSLPRLGSRALRT